MHVSQGFVKQVSGWLAIADEAFETVVNWWELFGGATAAWQAKGAVDQFYAKVDRTGNGHDLAFSPSWDQATGWTSREGSQAQTLLPVPGTGYTIAWRGQLSATPGVLWSSPVGWAGGSVSDTNTGSRLYTGHNNSSYTQAVLTYIAFPAPDSTYIFKKYSNYNQDIFINGVLAASKSGTTYRNQQIFISTHAVCAGIGVWHTTDIDATELHAAMMAI